MCKDMEEILKNKPGEVNKKGLLARWTSFDIRGLNIAPILPNTLVTYYKSLVGKEIRTFIQTAPFVLYKYLDNQDRHLWTALVCLCSFVYQTEITDMDSLVLKG